MKHTSAQTFTTLSVAVLLALLATSAITPDLGSVVVQAVPLPFPQSHDAAVSGIVYGSGLNNFGLYLGVGEGLTASGDLNSGVGLAARGLVAGENRCVDVGAK